MNTKEQGQQGESLAQEFLAAKGYILLEKNWYSGRNEVDLIMSYNDKIIFVEVKYRATNLIKAPYATVTREKQRSIVRVANHYMRFKKINKEAQFDIVSITQGKDKPLIEHLPNAFYAMR